MPSTKNFMLPDLYIRQVVANKTQKRGLIIDPRITLAINTMRPIISVWAGNQLADFVISGSYAKNTTVMGSTDLDLFISLKSDTTNTLKEIHDLLNKRLMARGYITRPQNVSIGITLNNLKIDLVPGVKQSPLTGDHAIYKRKTDSWVKTNIVKHINLVKNSRRTEEIRALKIWRELNGLDFPSFYLEMTVIEALRGRIFLSGLADNIWAVFGYLATKFENARIVDPANTNNIVSDDLTVTEKQAVAQIARLSLQQRYWENIIS